MRNAWLTLAAMAAALPGLWAQDVPDNRERKGETDARKTEPAAGACEVRVYLLGKDKKPADVWDVTASLMLEDKNGKKKTVAMQRMDPKASEKFEAMHQGQVRNVIDTEWSAEFIVMKPAARGDASPLGEQGRTGDPVARDGAYRKDYIEKSFDPAFQDNGYDEGKKSEQSRDHAHSGPYFTAQIAGDDKCMDCQVTLVLTVKGEKKTVTGFTLSQYGQGKYDKEGASATPKKDNDK